MRQAAATLLMCSALAARPALAQSIFSWTDASGVEHFTDDPREVPKEVQAKSTPMDAVPAPPQPEAKATAPVARPQPAKPEPRRSTPAAHALPSPSDYPAGLRESWRRAAAELQGPPSGPAFVRLADQSDDPQVVAAALHAVLLVYTPVPGGALAKFDGQSYPLIPADASVYRVALKRLDDADALVRFAAAEVARFAVSINPPDERVFAALATRMSRETDPSVRGALLDALWSCHSGRRELADAAIAFVEQDDDASRLQGLRKMSRVGKKGHNFDGDTRARMHRAARPFLSDPSPAVRAAADAAYRATEFDGR